MIHLSYHADCLRSERKGYVEMNEFVKFIAKASVALSIVLFVLLSGVAAVLIVAPEVLLKLLYYIAVIGCIGGACYFLICLLRALFAFMKMWKGADKKHEA